MSWLDGLRHRVRAVLRPGDHERDLRDEMGFHEDLDAMQQRDVGRARLRFGNRTYYLEETRAMTWLRWLDVLRQDLGYAWRSVRRTPGFTAMVVVTLALGIGVNAAVFTILDVLYLRPPSGLRDAGELRRVWFVTSGSRMMDGKGRTSTTANMFMYRAVVEASGRPRNFALYTTDNALTLGRSIAGPTVRGVMASANYFTVLGAKLALGRFYTAQEDSLGAGSRVVVLGHRFWQREFGGDTAMLGRPIEIGLEAYTVIGVVAPEFTGLDLQAADAWFPLGAPPGWGSGRWWESPNAWRFTIIFRSWEGGGDAEFEQRATAAYVASNREVWPVNPDTLGSVRTGSIIEARGPGTQGQDLIISTRIGGVAVIVLLIACANVINLLLARAVSRRRELAVRLALGISRGRLIRLLTTETVLLAAFAGAAALAAAWWGGALLRALLFPEVTWYDSVLQWRVVVFGAAVALLCGVVAGIVPAVQASNPQLVPALKEGAREGSAHRSRLRGALVITQAALSVMLLVGATLFVRSLQNVQGLDIGYDAKVLLFGTVNFDQGESMPASVKAAEMARVAERLRARPGVEGVAGARYAPMWAISWMTFYWDADSSFSLGRNIPTWQPVTSSFFETVGLRILRGRAFEDGTGAPREMVVDEAMAHQLWPGAEALGRCIRFEKRENPCYTVVGIAETSRQSRVIEEGMKPQYFIPIGNQPEEGRLATLLIVRARPDLVGAVSAGMTSSLRQAFPAGHPTVTPMTQNLEPEYRPWRLGATLFTAFGMLALIVAVIGIYSTVAYGVTQRTREFGVRMALGARVGDVLRLVVGEGLRVVVIGIAVGIALALAAGKLIAALLYGVEASDPGVMLLVAAVLLVVAGLAALGPAWRAARVDPVVALRSE
ncbi:MAG: ADOP family duplicated permease [Gemmatimonadaceae bacterium]